MNTKKYHQSYYARNRERKLAYSAEYQRSVRGKERKHGCKATRPPAERCECCGTPLTDSDRCFDHDHKLMVFRGWLCKTCNLVLGHVKDSRDRLQLLINYIDTWDLL